MERYSWQPAFDLKIVSMDRQHRLIFERMAHVESALTGNETSGGLNLSLDALEECCKMHFFDEERLMERRSFPSSVEHRNAHDHFVRALEEMHGLSPHQLGEQLAGFRDRFTDHIFNEDMRYAEFFLKKDGT